MSNEKKQTVLEANMAFDASPALFESIMDEGPIKYGPDGDGIDMITTPDGDEVVDPRSIMDVNVESPVQSGATFNPEVEKISQEDGDNYMSQFQNYIETVHKQEITDDDIDVAGATIQMLNNTRQDVAGYIRQQIADATARLSKQNANPAQPGGVAADMRGEGRIPSGGVANKVEDGLADAPDLGDNGLVEIDASTHLVPEKDDHEDVVAAPEQDFGEPGDLGKSANDDVESEPTESTTDASADSVDGADADEQAAEETAGADESSDDDDYDPFSDLDLGDVDDDAKSVGSVDEEPSPVDEDEEKGDVADISEPESDEESEDSEGNESKKSDALTESVHRKNFCARLESVLNSYDRLCKRREAQAKCEAIVAAANKKMLAESVAKKTVKAKCEAIVGAYRRKRGKSALKAKLESIVGKYRRNKMLAEAASSKEAMLRRKCNAIVESATRFDRMKAQCESIVNGYRKAASTADAARAIIDSYKHSLA